MKNKRIKLAIAGGMLLLFTACSTPAEQQKIKPTVVPAASPTSVAVLPITETPTMDATLTMSPAAAASTPTAVPTSTVTPTATVTPTPSLTPSPTPSPAPVWQGTEGEVSFSEAGYFFSEDLELELVLRSNKEGYITYTMDGSEPQQDGIRYEVPLLLEGTEEMSPKVYAIRAKAWYLDGASSDTYVHTYFVGDKVSERYSTMIFSITGNPSDLTEGPDGILFGENYSQRGRESERKVYIEAMSAEGAPLFQQYAGARVFGGSSREWVIKSLKLFARKEYQESMGTFETTVFGSKTLDGTKPINKYDKLVLRNGGDDFQNGFIRDELAQRLAEKAGFDAYEAVVPAVAYLNGEYYGFYWLHESYCDKYFQYRNGKSKGEYVVLEGSDRHKSYSDDEMENAAAKEYNALYKKYSNLDLTVEEHYEELCAVVDVENYLDYMSFNMYISNTDWPQGNYRCFRYYATEGEAYGEGEMDGRWRFLMHDADIGFAMYTSAKSAAQRNDVEQVLDSSHNRYSVLLKALLQREDCKQYFISKMLEYRDGVLSYESVCETLDGMCAERDTELEFYFDHFIGLKKNHSGIYASRKSTDSSIQKIKDFINLRGDYMTKYLEEYFNVELS